MASRFVVDASGVTRLAEYIQAVPQAAARAGYRAVNKIADKTLTRSRRSIVAKVNLSNGYVGDRLSVRAATMDNPTALVTARSRGTTLATYGAKQVTAPAPHAKGDALRGIPAGRVQAGVSVLVSKARGRVTLPKAFLVPLKGGNGFGVFVRTGRGRGAIRHLYGPSVAQLFSWVIPDMLDEVQADLEQAIRDQLDYELNR